ncbi:MAG: adenosylmethionine--8-amino-7-oxononanoate transaminase [Eudoraea sp.]|nr:adenosylmethionine--8-amino-7-oxononanoate transaminase [Eudoraea sp.]NNJ40453.1 adenosylmethionine--8-amino-7-oxononanoate transaminase [Eudoraea sp.]
MGLSQRDKKHIWHPLTQHKLHSEMLGITGARGATITDESGKEYIDAISSWYTCVYGHCNPYILEAVSSQMQVLDQVVFSGFTHEPAVRLSEALIEILPQNQGKLFFSDNGSTATEIEIKMALQYHFNRGERRNVLLAFEEGFHGDTFGAMSVSGLSVYNGPFEDLFLEVKRIPVPTKANLPAIREQLNELLHTHAIAGFIYEPLVQGAAGMKIHDAAGLNALLAILKAQGVVTIADEVMTGFGKTGSYFASDYLDEKPDIICLSKALTAGLMPMAVTTCTDKIFEAFYSDQIEKGFFHGHTYTANPLACSAALAGITLLRSDEMQANIQRIIRAHEEFDNRLSQHPMVKNTRQIGVIYAFDIAISMDRYGDLRDKLFGQFMERGIFLRPLGNTIYLLPPYVISDTQLEAVYSAVLEILDSYQTKAHISKEVSG